MSETETLKKIRELCTCGMHGTGIEVDDTPEIRERLLQCPASSVAGPPENRDDWNRKHRLNS